MDTTIAKLWVDALKTGKYKKGRLRLNNDNETFCCLGVLCELAMENGIELEKIIHDNGVITYDDSSVNLPDKVKEWAGIKTYLAEFGDRLCLSVLNDVNHTFNEVIKAIEDNAEKV